MRGANYVPSYARNDVQLWMDYDPAVIDCELGYAERMKLNTVRVFLQYAVYERDPKLFLERFENLLGLCAKHEIRMMPVLFDTCAMGGPVDLENYKTKNWMPCPGKDRLGAEHWPKLEQYVRDLVETHKEDPRIALWDVMNEPFYKITTDEDKELVRAFLGHFLDQVKALDAKHLRCVGFEHSSLNDSFLDQLDVVAFHNYRRDLREDVRAMKDLGKKTGKPVIITEVTIRPRQPFDFAMPILREEKIGWCFWELMLGKTQFSRGANPIQGVIYPDGTSRDVNEIAEIMDVSPEEAARLFPQRAGIQAPSM